MPNLLCDPSGNTKRKAFYHSDTPNRIITSTGHLFYFGQADEKTEKAFVSHVPTLRGTSAASIRSWYELFTQHASRHGIYVHPYFCFRAGTGSSKGFTCGTDTDSQQFDLPNELFHRLNHWNGKIHQALSKDGIFPSGCSFLSEISRGYGQGYDLLLKIIQTGHPSYNEYTSTLLGNRPTQSLADSLESYLDKYLDWLQLRAYLEDNPNNLNHPSELDNFLHGLQHGLEYLRLTHKERRSTDPIIQQKYSQGQIVGTLAFCLTLLILILVKIIQIHEIGSNTLDIRLNLFL